MYKNDLVTLTSTAREALTGTRWNSGRPTAWRRLSGEERQAWYEKFHADCRAGLDVWHDSAGESRLAPQDTDITLDPSGVWTVVRARVNAPWGYGSVKGCAEVIDSKTGEKFYINRKHLEVAR
jgi:hypothetical protein